MKLAVFIPAYNEASTIGGVISAIPGKINGISQIRIFVVDDGSTDGTEEVAGSALASRESLLARAAGAPREDRSGHPTFEVAPTSKVGCVSIKPNRGLANAFRTGLATARNSGADLIVHLDADGQYDPAEIPKLLAPIMNNAADMVTGDRQISKCGFLGPARQYGNLLGSWFLRAFTGVKVRDASCGFRAYSRAAAESLEVHSTHTYTHETLIEAKYKGLRVAEVPISFRHRGISASDSATPASSPCAKKPTSRLTSNLFKHIFKSLSAIFAARARYAKSSK